MPVRLPAEWERHQATIVAWPRRPEVWGDVLPLAEREYSHLISLISSDEDVVVVVHPADRVRVESITAGPRIHFLEHPIDDGWIRDNGPMFCMTDFDMLSVDFDFNSWGDRFSPSDGDRSAGLSLSRYLNINRLPVPWTLEGGALSTNGLGTFLLSQECILNSNRNHDATKDRVETLLRQALGLAAAVWVPYGLVEDLKNTDGHVDNVAVFCGRDKVLVQTVDSHNPNCTRLRSNIDCIRSILPDAEVIECGRLPYARMPNGELQPAPYVNLVLTNASVILPSVGDEADPWAIDFFGEVFPNRVVKLTPATALTYGGGGPHCVTMQIPSAPAARP